MSQIMLSRDENGNLVVSKYVPEPTREYSDEPYMTRREFLDFAMWLKYHVTEDEIPPDIRQGRTLFSRYTYDANSTSRNFLRSLKKLHNKELYREIAYLLKPINGPIRAARRDRESLFELPVLYEEDLFTVFRLYGIDPEPAKWFAYVAASGMYKSYSKYPGGKDNNVPEVRIPHELHEFCYGAGGLPTRADLISLFPDQYKRYQEEISKKKGGNT